MAFQREKLARWQDERRAAAIKQDMEQLDRLRRYLISGRQVHLPGRDLIDAIDDYVEKLTGDRTALHEKPSSIG